MLRKRIAVLTALICLSSATAVFAAFRTTVTRGEGFSPEDVRRAALVTVECHETIDCAKVEQKVFVQVAQSRGSLQLIPEQRVRQYLLSIGRTAYEESLRREIVEEFELNAVMELRIPFAERGEGYGGRRGSQVKVELVLVEPDGRVLVHAVGTGRPMNVVTSPERVASNVVEQLLVEIFE